MNLDLDTALKVLGLLLIVPGTLLSRAKLRAMRLENLKAELDILKQLDPTTHDHALVKASVDRKLRDIYGVAPLFWMRRVRTDKMIYQYTRTGLFINWAIILAPAVGFSYWTYSLAIHLSPFALVTGAVALLSYTLILVGPDRSPDG